MPLIIDKWQIHSHQVIVPEEKNSMLLGAAMLGMAAGEEEGLQAVVRKLQKISKVIILVTLSQWPAPCTYFPYRVRYFTYFQYRDQAQCSTLRKRLKRSTKQNIRFSFGWANIRGNTGIVSTYNWPISTSALCQLQNWLITGIFQSCHFQRLD